MSISILIAFRQLFSKHSFGFIYITSILSVIGLTIGLASLIAISCLSEGFSNKILHFPGILLKRYGFQRKSGKCPKLS